MVKRGRPNVYPPGTIRLRVPVTPGTHRKLVRKARGSGRTAAMVAHELLERAAK